MVDFLIKALDEYYQRQSDITKTDAKNFVCSKLNLLKADRSVFVSASPKYAIRFCYSSSSTFSNSVLSLKSLLRFDQIPFIVCLIRDDTYSLLLANTSFLTKISHSSHKLTKDNIVGTFLGHDIMRTYNGFANTPDNFEKLFDLHSLFDPEENLSRLVENTQNIVASQNKLSIDSMARQNISQSIGLINSPFYSSYFATIKSNLDTIVAKNKQEILDFAMAEPENVNLHGNKIEQIITSSINEHRFEDYAWHFKDGTNALIDIKTHLSDRNSSPKHQNIDKFLARLSEGNILSFIYFVLIDRQTKNIQTVLINNLDKKLIPFLRIQHHWAGRNSRGVTQIDGSIHAEFERGWIESLDIEAANKFIDHLISR